MIWISDEWKDYEVLDATNGERWSGGASIYWFAPTRR